MISPTRVVTVDDGRLARELAEGNRWFTGVQAVASVHTVDEALATGAVAAGRFHLVLLDLRLADGSDPIGNIRRLATAGRPVLVVSAWSDPALVAAAVAAGADGYLGRPYRPSELAAAIDRLVDDRPNPPAGTSTPPQLSPREQAVLLGYGSGLTLEVTARHIGIRPETAKTYLQRVKLKYRQAGRPPAPSWSSRTGCARTSSASGPRPTDGPSSARRGRCSSRLWVGFGSLLGSTANLVPSEGLSDGRGCSR